MNTYKLEIAVTDPFTSSSLNATDTAYIDAVTAANRIEMKWSEYFVWEEDDQESLSRSNAISYAEKDIQEYPANVREHVWWKITTWRNGHKLDGYVGHARRVTGN